MLLPPIPITYLLLIITFLYLMRNWSSTSRASFRTTPLPPLLFNLYNRIPPFFQNSSHLTYHHSGLLQFQHLPTGILQLTCPKPCHNNFLRTQNLRSLSKIHPIIPVNIQVMITQALYHHPQVCHPLHPQKILMIKMALILCYPQF